MLTPPTHDLAGNEEDASPMNVRADTNVYGRYSPMVTANPSVVVSPTPSQQQDLGRLGEEGSRRREELNCISSKADGKRIAVGDGTRPRGGQAQRLYAQRLMSPIERRDRHKAPSDASEQRENPPGPVSRIR
jgi:hypothetical protein